MVRRCVSALRYESEADGQKKLESFHFGANLFGISGEPGARRITPTAVSQLIDSLSYLALDDKRKAPQQGVRQNSSGGLFINTPLQRGVGATGTSETVSTVLSSRHFNP